MHPNPKRIIPVVLILAVAGTAYWYYNYNRASAANNEIAASGTIEATNITISPELAGRAIAVKVGEGDAVNAGDVLVQLDGALLQAQHDQAAAALAATQANYDSLNNGAGSEQLQAAISRTQTEVVNAQQALDALNDTAGLATSQAASELAHARDVLKKATDRYNNLHHPDLKYYQDRVDDAQNALLTVQQNKEIIDIGALQATLQAANDRLDTARDRLGKIQAAINGCPTCDPKRSVTIDRIPQTLDDAKDAFNDVQNAVSALELQINQANRTNTTLNRDTQKNLDDAKRDLNWALEGPDAIQEAMAKADLDLAQSKLDDAQRNFADVKNGVDADKLAAAQARLTAAKDALAAAQAAAAPDRLNAARAQVDVAKTALAVLDVQTAKLTLNSPTAGTVISRAVEPGEAVLPGATVFEIADLSHLQITVYIPEDQFGTVTLGEGATVKVDSFPNDIFTATVSHIADQAEFTPRNVQTVDGRKTTVFAIKLTIDNPQGQLKAGMPADVTFGK
jgi:HlyD family secretion protein